MPKCNVCRDGSPVHQNRNGSWLERCPACGEMPDPSSLSGKLEELQASVGRVQADLALQTGGAPYTAKREPGELVRELQRNLGLTMGDAGCPTRRAVERLRDSPAVKRDTERHVRDCYRAAGSRRFRKGGN